MVVVRKQPVKPTTATSPNTDKARRIFIPASSLVYRPSTPRNPMLRGRKWFTNLSQVVLCSALVAQLLKKPLRRSLSPPLLVLGRLQQLDRQFHVSAPTVARLADEAIHDRSELRRQRLLQVLVTLTRPQRLFLRFFRLCRPLGSHLRPPSLSFPITPHPFRPQT